MRRGSNQYRWLAEYYDEFFDFHVTSAATARKRVLGKILDGVETACDLCCGTGTTAVQLAGNGVRMYGVDHSPIMCRKAREKAAQAGVEVRVVRADMRSFRLPEPVDVVLCEFDALNHVPKKADLRRVAASAARALRPGGHFFFDVNNRLAFQKVWSGTWWVEKPGKALVMHGGYDKERDIGWSEAHWFLRRGRKWSRSDERIEQVAWTSLEIRAVLRATGFDRVRAWDATPFFGKTARIWPGCRTYYLARKGP
jgi:SAM-dependent methyltransferase